MGQLAQWLERPDSVGNATNIVPNVYILRSLSTERFYVGCTGNMERCLREHNDGKSRSTKAFRPWELAHTEHFPTLAEARKRERALKAKKSRRSLTQLIAGD